MNLKNFIKENKHLPNVPGKKDVEKNGGFSVSEFQMKTLEKTEENTLYILQLKKEIEALKNEVKQLKDK